ncbi:MAG TPA: DUF4412 domain-containing protein [Xanthomonadaceae bacterium]|nr:DUF4412 domain-containing protein [Xanthomonadaceae bacterium]
MNRSIAVLFAIALPISHALADARIEYRATEGGGASMQSLLIGHGKLRTDTDANTSVILDPDTRSMTVLDHGKRQFTRIGPAELQQLSETLNEAMAQLEQAMASVPPEMRAQMQGMLGGAIPGMGGEPMVRIVDTGSQERVAGHACTVYLTEMQGKTVSEACMGGPGALAELTASDRAVLDRALAMTRDMMEQLAKSPLGQLVQATPFRDGMVPLRITDFDNNRRSTSEFAGVQREALAADLFQVPSGYREQKIEMPRGRR